MKAKLTIISMFIAVLGFSGAVQAGHKHGHKANKVHGHDALMVSIGASTSFGYTFDSSLLGLPFGYYLAENHHLPLFAEYLKSYFGVQDVINYNFSYPGKTSDEVLAEQVPQLLEVIPRNTLHKVVFTVEGGGNDLRHFQVANADICSSADPMDQYMCVVNLNETLDQVEDNLWHIITTLQDAVPEAIIIVQTQYNSLYDILPNGADCVDETMLGVADLALEGNPAYGHPVAGLNTRIRELAADLGVAVGDISGYLYTAPGNLYQNPDFFGGDCTHLSGVWDGLTQYGIPGDDTGLGYQAILGSFIAALPPQ